MSVSQSEFLTFTYALRVQTGASAILLLSSLPRVAKGPVPLVLAVTSAASGAYYGKTVYALRA